MPTEMTEQAMKLVFIPGLYRPNRSPQLLFSKNSRRRSPGEQTLADHRPYLNNLLSPVLNVQFITRHFYEGLQRPPVVRHENKISRNSLGDDPEIILVNLQLKRCNGIDKLFWSKPFLLFLFWTVFLKQPRTYSPIILCDMLINEKLFRCNTMNKLPEGCLQGSLLLWLYAIPKFEFPPGYR